MNKNTLDGNNIPQPFLYACKGQETRLINNFIKAHWNKPTYCPTLVNFDHELRREVLKVITMFFHHFTFLGGSRGQDPYVIWSLFFKIRILQLRQYFVELFHCEAKRSKSFCLEKMKNKAVNYIGQKLEILNTRVVSRGNSFCEFVFCFVWLRKFTKVDRQTQSSCRYKVTK